MNAAADPTGPARLPHTGLRVPHARYRVTSLRQHKTHDGVAYAATLRYDGKTIGTIENQGTGGPTTYYPNSLRTQPGHHSREDLDAYAAQCTTDAGEPESAEMVLDNLVTEYEWPKRIAKAAAKNRIVLRFMTHLVDGDHTVGEPYPTYEVQVAAHLLDKPDVLRTVLLRDGATGPVSWWQVYDGTAWRDATERPAIVPADRYL